MGRGIVFVGVAHIGMDGWASSRRHCGICIPVVVAPDVALLDWYEMALDGIVHSWGCPRRLDPL